MRGDAYEEMCEECENKSGDPRTDCFEVKCQCKCHWSIEQILENEKAMYDAHRETSRKEDKLRGFK